MCLCTLCTERFLECVAGGRVFRAYCRRRHLPCEAWARPGQPGDAAARWSAAVGALPAVLREQVTREQGAVCDLATPRGNMHLLAASEGGFPPADISEGGSLALWFLVRRPRLFWQVFRRHQHRESDVWHAAIVTAGARMSEQAGPAFSAPLKEFFRRLRDARGCFTVYVHRLPTGVCLVARGSGRLASPSCSPWRAACAQLAYYPGDGTLLLQAPLAPPDLIEKLLADSAFTLLGDSAPPARKVFDLGRLRLSFRPLPDANGVEFVRVRALHLRYPARSGSRLLTLQSPAGHDITPVDALLAEHVRPDELPDLHVSHAELHVRLPGDSRPRDHLVRLWPDRCDLGPGPAGDLVLACLRRWGL